MCAVLIQINVIALINMQIIILIQGLQMYSEKIWKPGPVFTKHFLTTKNSPK